MAVVSNPKAIEHLKIKEKNECNRYLSDRDINDNTIIFPKALNTPEYYDLIVSEILSDEIKIHDYGFVTAIQICHLLAKKIKQRLEVTLVGFDFEKKNGDSQKTVDLNLSKDQKYISRIMSSQLNLLKLIMEYQDELSLEIKHIGTSSISTYTASSFNSLNEIKNNVKNTQTKKKEYQVKITAEITTNHFGDKRRLEAMIKSAAAAGADYVKVSKERC